MSRARVLVGFALIGLAAVAVSAYARQQPAGELPAAPDAPADAGASSWPDWMSWAGGIESAIGDLQQEVSDQDTMKTLPTLSVDANVRAFLEAIKRCEGTAGQPDPYRVCYAYRHSIADLSDHPAVTGEWRGEPLTDTQCRGAGYGPGCVSTAAGAYQITKPTWTPLKARLGLRDFGPAAQDAAAVQILRQCGAYERLAAGDLPGAVARARSTWASLPGANYAGQGMRSMSQVVAWYQGAGGAVLA